MAASATGRWDLPILVAAVGVSAGGDIAAITALAVHMQATTGSGLLVAAVFAANWLALAAVSPWGGRLVYRVESRAVLGWASLAQALVALALAFTPGTGLTLALVALLGVGAAVAVPAEFALLGVVGVPAGTDGPTGAWRRRAMSATPSARSPEARSRPPPGPVQRSCSTRRASSSSSPVRCCCGRAAGRTDPPPRASAHAADSRCSAPIRSYA